MRFEEVEAGRWIKRETKTREPLVITLPWQARELVRARRVELGSGYVLPGRKAGMLYACRQRLAARLREVVPDYRHHDVRRTVRTGLAELGVRFEVAEMILGHSRGGITETYDRHRYQGEIAEALQAWADRLEAVTA